MLTTPHVLTALVIVKIFPQPILAIGLAFLSHFMLDFFIPHWNPHIYTEMSKDKKISLGSFKIIILDSLLALSIFLFLAYQTLPDINTILVYGTASFIAILPDLVEIPYYFFKSKNKLLKQYVDFEHKYQANGTFFWGMITQLLVVLASLKQLFF